MRLNGRVFEAAVAGWERRTRRDLYHSALVVRLPEGDYAVEMGPEQRGDGAARGAVAGGPVGSRLLRRWRIFRYEVRRERDGVIPDVAEAVDSPRRLTGDELIARHLFDLVARVPTPVWGRDELGTGEMWNSNSLTSWVIARSGLPVEHLHPPAGGRAPGWDAGLAMAARAAGPPDPLSPPAAPAAP
ncbi:MAG: hypothetical protein JHC74_03865 [Thermoleophilia bacterium]|nr:hypothetical protein [Thermoleophilia bacterium]